MKEKTLARISYYVVKNLDNVSTTRSLNKIEKEISTKDNPVLRISAVIYAYHNKRNVNPLKHPNLFESYEEYKWFIKECSLKFEDGYFKFDEKKAISNFGQHYIKTFEMINEELLLKKKHRDVKEITRLATDRIIKTYKISITSISDKLKNNKVDSSNFHKFINNKDYSKISMESIEELNEVLKGLDEVLAKIEKEKEEKQNENI